MPNLGDFDQDGALDLVITATYSGRPTDFYWGVGDGTFVLDAYHSGLSLTDGYVSGGNGQGGQNSPAVHFRLGAGATAGAVDSVSVTFPGGKTVQYPGPFDANQRLWLFEDGAIHLGWAPPL